MSDSATLCAAVLTPSGRGAVAVIKIIGDLQRLDGCFRAVNGKSIAQQPLNKISYGHWGTEPVEDVVVIRIAEQVAEVHCHGGNAAVARLAKDIKHSDGQIVSWRDIDENKDPWERQYEAALLKCTTLKTAKLLLRQSTLYPAAIRRFATTSKNDQLAQIETMLHWANFGMHLTTPWQVVLCGRPNVGKSSLINALVGYQRSVVFDQPGTTRDVVSEQTALSGWPIELSDTAGIRETTADIELQGIQRAKEHLRNADLQIIVIDATTGVTKFDEDLLNEFPSALVISNKSDLANNPDSSTVLSVSALTKNGIEKLQQQIVTRLIPELPTESVAFPVTQNQLVSLRKLRDVSGGEIERLRDAQLPATND